MLIVSKHSQYEKPHIYIFHNRMHIKKNIQTFSDSYMFSFIKDNAYYKCWRKILAKASRVSALTI
jgi:hypothetical protein